jgi:ferrous iron transport protein B
VADGIFGGVGGVLAFLPQILILFVFIAILEDCGYLARAAYLMDRLMSHVGLSGKSFIPLLSSCACAIPGIMSARVIENERDRLTTILVAPLMTCSARLPVYALLIAAFVPARAYCGGLVRLQGLTLTAMYALGIMMAVVVALLLKRTILRGETPPFVMELPSYKLPSIQTIFFRVVERGVVFLRCAGTLILAVSILIWALLYYPHDAKVVEAPFRPQVQALESRLAALAPGDPQQKKLADQLVALDHQIAGAYQRQSWLGRAGRRIEPVFKPLGWDWRISSAVLASFPAREIVVATLGVIYNLGKDVDTETHEGLSQLSNRLHAATWDGTNRPVFNLPVAFSIMVFFTLCAQCAATLAVIRRETNSWRWPAFTFAYMTVLAYVGALLTYQVGMWIAAGPTGMSL